MAPKIQKANEEKVTSGRRTGSKNSNGEKINKNIMEEEKLPTLKVLLACASCFGLMNALHVSSMFENDRHFSHLSNLEREMTFRTEMGLYYNYYKTIVEAPSFVEGLNRLLFDNRTEYPDTINTLQRFNLYHEVVLGGTYRFFKNVLESVGLELPKVCWGVVRGKSLSPIVSCEGIGDPIYWYLNGVWLAAGCTAALIFLHGVQLSGNMTGGIIAGLCFFFNHAESTRVMWTPPLRESFAFPFSILLNIIITYSLRRPKVDSWVQLMAYATVSLNYLLCWQFSQFTIVANIAILYVMYTFRVIPALPMLLVLLGAFTAFVNNVVLQFMNPMLLVSLLASTLLGVLLLYIFIEPLIGHLPAPMDMSVQAAFMFLATMATKIELTAILGITDDAHIFNILKAKVTNYSDFHTLLYTCSAEFDFMPMETLHKLNQTLLLPCVMLVGGAFLANTLSIIKKNFVKRVDEDSDKKTPMWDGVDAAVLFNFLLLGVYGGMAGFIMRLKVFLTPHMCVMASMVTARRYFPLIKRKEIHQSIVAVLVAFMCIRGLKNISDQCSIVGEYSNPELESMIKWIEEEVGQEAVFAGPMPTMATVLLATGRPIVNHPHYENAELRERTKNVYSIFSRRSAKKVYETLIAMKVNYIILDEQWCLRKSKPGCGMVDLWDVEEPLNRKRPALCPKLYHKSPLPFHKVFWNDVYVILQVPSKYVEIPAPRVQSS